MLADFGFVTHRLTDDWQGADFIAQHIDGETFLIRETEDSRVTHITEERHWYWENAPVTDPEWRRLARYVAKTCAEKEFVYGHGEPVGEGEYERTGTWDWTAKLPKEAYKKRDR